VSSDQPRAPLALDLAGRRGGIVLRRSPFEPGIVTRGVGIGLLLAVVTAAVGWPLTRQTPIATEVDAVVRVNIGQQPWLLDAATALSNVGHLVPVAAVAVVAALVARRQWGGWDLGLLLLVVLGGASAITGTVKLLTARTRPDSALVETFSSAYPSGHAVRAAAVYGLIAWLVLLVVRRRLLRLAVAALAVAVIVLNALARVSLAAHWPSDVLVGVVLGTIWLVVSLQLLRPHTLAAERRRVAEAGIAERGLDAVQDGASRRD
jgi:membrane-associated phospholipid phosphatase